MSLEDIVSCLFTALFIPPMHCSYTVPVNGIMSREKDDNKGHALDDKLGMKQITNK